MSEGKEKSFDAMEEALEAAGNAHFLDEDLPTGMDYLFFVPDHKFLICMPPKNGHTAMGTFCKCAERHRCSAQFSHATVPIFAEILQDPGWRKVYVIRDPAERFLSVFLSKCAGHDGEKGLRVCRSQYRTSEITFNDAIDQLVKHGIRNPHWKQQHKYCGDLAKIHEQFDVEIFYDGSTYAADLAKELRLAGAMGADDIHLKECFNMTYEAHYNIKDAHIAHSEKLVLEYYESQAQVQKVHDFYIDDYEIFNIPWPPEWFHSLPP